MTFDSCWPGIATPDLSLLIMGLDSIEGHAPEKCLRFAAMSQDLRSAKRFASLSLRVLFDRISSVTNLGSSQIGVAHVDGTRCAARTAHSAA